MVAKDGGVIQLLHFLGVWAPTLCPGGALPAVLSQFSALECLLQPQGLGPGLKPQLLMEMASHSPHSLSYRKLSWSCWEAC